MGRTNIVLDDRLVREALRRFGCRSKRELVHLALVELLKSARRRDLLSLRGQVKWEGDRSAQGIINGAFFARLAEIQPDILDRIKKIVTRYPDGPSWGALHDGEFGFNEDKRTVRIRLNKGSEIDGEEVDEIHVQGVLFTKKGYERGRMYQPEKLGRGRTVRGTDFDRKGCLIYTPFKLFLLGAASAQIAKQKYENSLRMRAEGMMRAPLVLGFLSYDFLYIDQHTKQLGVFIYAQRKNVPERALKLMRMPDAPLEEFFESYGRALRESYNFQGDPSLANVTLYISGKEKPIYHDLGEIEFRRDLTPEQAARLLRETSAVHYKFK